MHPIVDLSIAEWSFVSGPSGTACLPFRIKMIKRFEINLFSPSTSFSGAAFTPRARKSRPALTEETKGFVIIH
jgi:hypothetical protein